MIYKCTQLSGCRRLNKTEWMYANRNVRFMIKKNITKVDKNKINLVTS